MASLNATDPASAVAQGLYVPTPGTVAAERLVTRLQLQPSAALAVVGGIGSGKTTQLLVARDKLEKTGDAHAIYVDVAEKHDISRMEPGILAVVAGLAMGQRFCAPGAEYSDRADVDRALAEIRAQASGPMVRQEELEDCDPALEGLVQLPARLVPPSHERSWAVTAMESQVAVLLRALRETKPHVVLLVDSLDRLVDREAFVTVVEQDVRALSELGIGVVMAAPLRSLYGVWRATLDHFETFEYLPPVDVENKKGAAFLGQVLQARIPADGLEAVARTVLVESSGGVLRDLLQLARLAVEEAYLSGAQRIEETHVRAASDVFGRKHIFGVTPTELATLQRLRRHQEFVPTSDDDLALLTTRRVLEYQRGRVEYAPHPTLVPLLEQLAHAA